MVFNETPLKRAGPPKTKVEPSIFARREEREGLAISHELNLEDLVMDVRSESPPARSSQTKTLIEPLKRSLSPVFGSRSRSWHEAASDRAGGGRTGTPGDPGYRRRPPAAFVEQARERAPVAAADVSETTPPVDLAPPDQARAGAARRSSTAQSGRGWMLCNRAPVPRETSSPTDSIRTARAATWLFTIKSSATSFSTSTTS